MIELLEGGDDERLADYTRLTDVALRRKLEPERGLYMAESTGVIQRAVEAGHVPRSILTAREWLDDLAGVIAAIDPDTPVFVAPRDVLEQITGFHLHRGALAAMQRPELPALADVLAGARRVAIFEDFVDHTNVGAAMRSAAALGIDAVLVTPRCADPLYRRAVRVSMGTVFQVPWTRIDPWPGALDLLRAEGFTIAALALSERAVSLDDFVRSLPQRFALVFGTEGDGLSRRALAACDTEVVIPMAHGVDSLNVAAATAVAFWATR